MTTTSLGEALAPEFRCIENFTGAAIAKYLCVKMVPAEAPDSVVVTAADTDVPHAITSREVPAAIAGQPGVGDGVIRGRTRVTASGAITAGDRIAPDANGKVKTAVAGDIVIGKSLDTCTADNDIIMAEVDLVAPVLF